MIYEQWKNDIFGKPEGYDPVCADLLDETANLTEIQVLDFIDLALEDPKIHTEYSIEQIGIGLNIIFSNTCSDISYCYVLSEGQMTYEQRKIESVKHIRKLYSNFFSRYCVSTVESIGETRNPRHMSFICYMLWDIFVLYPGNASPAMTQATIEMMANCLMSTNDNCLESIIHGLGHWALDCKLAKETINEWLKSPTTDNKVIIDYANQAKTGFIL
jgi:hypothetical protein